MAVIEGFHRMGSCTPREVARVLGVGRLRCQTGRQLLARVVGALVGDGGDVKVKLLQQLLVRAKSTGPVLEL